MNNTNFTQIFSFTNGKIMSDNKANIHQENAIKRSHSKDLWILNSVEQLAHNTFVSVYWYHLASGFFGTNLRPFPLKVTLVN